MNPDNEREEFVNAMARLPRPVSCFSNGACCPWCGGLKHDVSFVAMNTSEECEREFAFGYPSWHSEKDPISWVPFPHREFDELGGRADLFPAWQPNKRLQAIYFEKAEEQLGKQADMSRAN